MSKQIYESIPGVLQVTPPAADPIPLVFDSPHSGMEMPKDFDYVAPMEAIKTSWDAYVDELYAPAAKIGATLLRAEFPRSYLDLNRSEFDIDQELLDAPWPHELKPSNKTKSGMGLLRRFALPGVPVYARRLGVAEVEQRIAQYYRPYYQTLGRILDRLHGEFACVYHVDCHSMKSVGNAMNSDNGVKRPDFVISDREHRTSDRDFTRFAAWSLDAMGYVVKINDPYKGAELVRAFGDPGQNRHSIQIEINRALYMNEDKFEKLPEFALHQSNLARLAQEMAGYIREQ